MSANIPVTTIPSPIYRTEIIDALPFSQETADVRELSGVEEDVIVDEEKWSDGRAINHVLTNCTLQLSRNGVGRKPSYEDVVALKVCDRLALLLAIRRASFGPVIESSLICQTCQKPFDVQVSLDHVKPFMRGEDGVPWAAEDFPDGAYSFTVDDLSVRARLLDGKAERMLSRVSREEILTAALAVQIVEVRYEDGSTIPTNSIRQWVRSLSMATRMKLRNAVESHQLGPDTRFDASCIHCSAPTIRMVERLRDFFFPAPMKGIEL